MVDGEIFDFKIIEEWGFTIGEDACLFDNVETQADDELQSEGVHEEMAAIGDVKALLHHLSEDWQKEGSVDSIRKSVGYQEAEAVHSPSVPKLVASAVVKEVQNVTNELQVTSSANTHAAEIITGDMKQCWIFVCWLQFFLKQIFTSDLEHDVPTSRHGFVCSVPCLILRMRFLCKESTPSLVLINLRVFIRRS